MPSRENSLEVRKSFSSPVSSKCREDKFGSRVQLIRIQKKIFLHRNVSTLWCSLSASILRTDLVKKTRTKIDVCPQLCQLLTFRKLKDHFLRYMFIYILRMYIIDMHFLPAAGVAANRP